MTDLVTTSRHGDIAVVHVNNPPVNALSPGVPEGLLSALEAAAEDTSISGIVIAGAGRTFVAGADIATLEAAAWGQLDAAPNLHALFARIEDSAKPVVMAIHGTALGGGLELAMAGHYRVAVPGALVGQPEVNLGIIPGAEGTQRLPRLVGIAKALEMCVSGRPLKAPDALAAGLLDAIVEGDLTEKAVAFARSVIGRPAHPKTRALGHRLGAPEVNEPLFTNGRVLAARTRQHQTAPLRAIEAIEAAATLPFLDGCRREREIFLGCVESEQAKALIHLFFAERAVAKIPDVTPDITPYPVNGVAIVGAGTMGGGIAMACANAGITVRLNDVGHEALDAGLSRIRHTYDSSVARGRFTQTDVDVRMARIHPQVGFDGFESADVVIEAAFENLDLKKRLFQTLGAVARPDSILATNTSTLSIDTLASVTSRPASVVGLHFFSPANVMRLVEIVRGRATSAAVIATALALSKRLGKVGVVVGDGPGFVGNRMMFPYMYETQFLVEEGATPQQVDLALTDFGMAMGMFAVDDMAGLDVAWRVRQELGHFREPGVRRPLVQDELYARGRLGQKVGKGWYRYTNGRTPLPDPDVVNLIRSMAAEAGIPQRHFSDSDIVERSIYALINEGARVLDDGLVRRSSDIDVIYANGYGFPTWRGGPMFYADRVGLAAVLATINEFHQSFGERWAPAPLLIRLASAGSTFREFDRARATTRAGHE